MSAIAVSLIAFAFVFGGAMLGILLHSFLPGRHLNSETKEVVKLGMGLVGTVAALVLGLLVASAKGTYDTQSNELTEMSAKVALLDRVLAHYGPETKGARDQLRTAVVYNLDNLWAKEASSRIPKEGPSSSNEIVLDKIQELSPQGDAQHSLKDQASSLVLSLGQTRWLMYAQRANPVSMTLVAMLVFWLMIIFISFGLFAPRNMTVVASLFLAALAISGAILLILEMSAPYSGLIQISKAPLMAALSRLGQ